MPKGCIVIKGSVIEISGSKSSQIFLNIFLKKIKKVVDKRIRID